MRRHGCLEPWGSVPPSGRRAWLWCALALLLLPDSAAAQTQGIRGTVTRASSRTALSGATVRVVGTALGTTTDSRGRFELLGVPQGSHVVQVTAIGFASQNRQVPVEPARVTVVDFALSSVTGPLVVFEPPGSAGLPVDSLRVPFPDSSRIGQSRQLNFLGFDPMVGQRLRLDLANGVVVTVQGEQITPGPAGGFTWTGSVVVPPGVGESVVVLVVREGQLTGNIRFSGRLFHVRPQRDRLHVIVEVAASRLPMDVPRPGDPPVPVPPGPPAPEPPTPPVPPPWIPPSIPFPRWIEPFRTLWLEGVWMPPKVCSDFSDMMAGGFPAVRVLVWYTDVVAASAGGDIHADIEVMIEEANIAYERSGIRLRLELAESKQVSAQDDYTVGETVHRARLLDRDDGILDEVHDSRDATHADAVVLLVKMIAGGGAAGPPNGKYEVTRAMEEWAFAVVNFASAVGNFELPHELGHVMGAQHDRGSGALSGEPYQYNFGYVGPAGTWKTIMSTSTSNSRVARFSNPDRTYNGVATGVGTPSPLSADNRRTFLNTASVVSSFRLSPVWLVSAGANTPWLDKRVADELVEGLLFGDFNNDRETDAFLVDAANGRWLWSPSSRGAWQVLNASGASLVVPLGELALGDFDGDGETDVFRSDITTGTWYWSRSGRTSWQVLNAADPSRAVPVTELAFADFDGDMATDVFYSDVEEQRWFWSKGGSAAWAPLNGPDASLAIVTSGLSFADFDGDGKADVFRAALPFGRWYWSQSGTSSWQQRGTISEMPANGGFGFGDFDGDGKADVFKSNGTAWYISRGGLTAWEFLLDSCYERPALRFGDFDGDGTIDVFRTGIRP